ncbi:hypothetical protein LINPERHAP1_LOCUS29088 [Linum perenne]
MRAPNRSRILSLLMNLWIWDSRGRGTRGLISMSGMETSKSDLTNPSAHNLGGESLILPISFTNQ